MQLRSLASFRWRPRAAVLLAGWLLLCPWVRSAVGAETPKRAFDLPADFAEKSLKAFSDQAGVEVLFPSDAAAGVRTNAVKGEFVPLEAAKRMLAGTVLYVRDQRDGVLRITRAPDPNDQRAAPRTAGVRPSDDAVLAPTSGLRENPARRASSRETGSIGGRVFDPATGEYVRNARVEIKETGQFTFTEFGGEYQLAAVPSGAVTVSVIYAGYTVEPANVLVTAGNRTTQNFEIVSTLGARRNADGVIEMQKMTVSGDREGNAKALAEQRRNMNVTDTIASDVFGDFPEGNVGNVLRLLPGIDVAVTWGGEPTQVAMRGLGPEYTSVVIDGLSFASADANNMTGNTARITKLEMTSLSNLDSIEVSKTISADVDANAPAGAINLRTKRAFDRKGRRVVITASAALNSEAFTSAKTRGPYFNKDSFKARPGGSLEYSDVFLNNRLGILLSLQHTSLYGSSTQTEITYNRSPTAADPRPQIVGAFTILSQERIYDRTNALLNVDFHVTPELAVGLKIMGLASDNYSPQRELYFHNGTRSSVQGDGFLNFTGAANAYVEQSSAIVNRYGKTLTLSPSAEWRRDTLAIEGRLAWSNAKSWHDPNDRGVIYNTVTAMRDARVPFKAERSDLLSADWHLTQTAGPDIALPRSFAFDNLLQVDDTRLSRQIFTTAKIDATLKTNRWLPVTWKAGFKYNSEYKGNDSKNALAQYTYTGPAGFWDSKAASYRINGAPMSASITSISGNPIFMADMAKAYEAFRDHPEFFRPTVTADGVYNALVANRLRYTEDIDAAYLMGTAQLSSKASLRGGLRWEETTDHAELPDSYTSDQVQAAGYQVDPETGRARTVDGILYQFLSRPRVRQETSRYAKFFPSASFKYALPWDIDLSFGFSTTIRRAPYSYSSSVTLVNDEEQVVTVVNKNLKPEDGKNFALRLARYATSVGQLSVSFFQNEVENKFITDVFTAEEFGNTQPEYANYLFSVYHNSQDAITFRGVEIAYSQQLGAISPYLRGFGVSASYTRSYASQEVTSVTPHSITGSVTYRNRLFSVNANALWNDDRLTTISTYKRWVRHDLNMSAGANVRLTRNLQLQFNASNLLNRPKRTMQQHPNLDPVLFQSTTYGANYTFALKATF